MCLGHCGNIQAIKQGLYINEPCCMARQIDQPIIFLSASPVESRGGLPPLGERKTNQSQHLDGLTLVTVLFLFFLDFFSPFQFFYPHHPNQPLCLQIITHLHRDLRSLIFHFVF